MKKFHAFLLMLLLLLIGCQAQDITNEGSDRQALLVEVAKVTEQNIQKNIELQGTALPKNQVPLITPTPLRVEQINKTVGQTVEKDEVIILLNDETARRQVEQARKIVNELENALQKANQLNQATSQNLNELENIEKELRASLRRTEELIANRGEIELEEFIRELLASTISLSTKQTQLSQAAQSLQQQAPVNTFELDMQLANARENLRQMELALEATQLKAPFTGIIGQMDVAVGQTALPNSPLATVIVLDPILATFTANSFQISLLETGLQTTVEIEGTPEPIVSTISTVSPTINPQTNTFTVEVELENPQNKIKGGMRAKAIVDLDVIDKARVIPIDSILYEDNEPYVFTITDQTANRQPISVGVRDGIYIEMIEGLNIDDIVITTGKERVTDGAKISIRNE